MQVYLQELSKALQEEIRYSKEQEKTLLAQSPQQLRKEGYVFFPLSCIHFTQGLEYGIFELKASFVLNESFIKKGARVLVKAANQEIAAYVNDLHAQEIIISTKEEIDFNPKEEDFEVWYQNDDRTFRCMELGIKLMENDSKLQSFHQFEKQNIDKKNFEDLNESQQIAINTILSEQKMVCVQGPPGTGKTHLLAKSIQALIKEGKKLIISAPSNTAVDNLCKKIIPFEKKLLRLGNEEKIASDVLPYTLDAWIEQGSTGKVIEHLSKSRRNLQQITDRFSRSFSKEHAEEKRNARKEIKEISKEIRQMIQQRKDDIIDSAIVIAGTPVSLFNYLNKHFQRDVIIIDEAGQALAPLSFLAASFGKRVVLCGDPKQLPPTVLNPKSQSVLGKSWLQELYECKKENFVLLNTQYRMDKGIVDFSNSSFYDNQLLTASNQQGKIQFIDMAGYGEGEIQSSENGSISNPSEVEIIEKLIHNESIDLRKTIIIAPYNGQVSLIQEKFPAQHVSTIDSIQGQEAEIIIISLTRSNENREIGFLKDYRRTNVALTRAMKNLYVIGDSACLSSDEFYSSMVDFFETQGCYRSAWEFG